MDAKVGEAGANRVYLEFGCNCSGTLEALRLCFKAWALRLPSVADRFFAECRIVEWMTRVYDPLGQLLEFIAIENSLPR